jgi:hypothetical protein
LRVFYSGEDKLREPNEHQSQKCYVNPKTVPLLPAFGRDVFTSDWVYLGFYSGSGCVLGLQVKFPEDSLPIKIQTKKEVETPA